MLNVACRISARLNSSNMAKIAFKAIAFPEPSKGSTIAGKSMVVPHQALSLREILERFTRAEELPVFHEGNYDDGEDDLEKVAHADLVDKEEFMHKMEDVKKRFEAQEKRKKKQAEEKAIAEAAKRLREEEASKKPVSGDGQQIKP